MKIEDLIQLLNNRLREFKLSRDYARMSGDLERMNTADKEIGGLEDTLYKLNLLVDTSKSAAVKEVTLAEAITDGSVAVLGDYDITPYATDPEHEKKVMSILSNIAVMDTAEKIDAYIKGKYPSSPVTGEMIINAAEAYVVDARLMMAIMEQDSRFGTVGVAVKTLNPGNVGNNDDGDTITYESWQEGVTAVAEWLSRHHISTTSTSPTATSTSPTSTSTPPMDISTSTPSITTSTPPTATSTLPTATSTPSITTSTPPTATSTSPTATSTSPTSTSTPPMDISTSTPPIATSTPPTATSTLPTATSTPSITTSTPPVATSTSPTATSTSSTDTSTSADLTFSAQPTPEVVAGTASSSHPTQDESGQATTTQETATSTAN